MAITNNATDIQVVVTMVDKMSAEMTAMRQHVEKQLNATAAAGKKVAQEQGVYAHKFNQSMKQLATYALSTTGIIMIGRQLAAGLKDAGIQTDRIADSMRSMRVAFAGPIKDDVEQLFTSITDNTEAINAGVRTFVNALLSPFRLVSASLMSIMSVYSAITRDKAMMDAYRSMAEEEYVKLNPLNWAKAGKIEGQPWKKAAGGGGEKASSVAQRMSGIEMMTGGKSLSDLEDEFNSYYAGIIESHGGYVQAWYDTKPAIDAVLAWQSAASVQTQHDFEASISALNEMYASGMIADEKFTSLSMELSQRRMDQEELEFQHAMNLTNQRMQMSQQLTNLTINTMETVLRASGANEKKMRAIRIAGVWADFMAASASAAQSIWRGAGNVYEKIALTAATAGMLTTQAIANTVLINKQKFATGGRAREGWARVGEHGPEDVYFGAPGYVYDANRTRAMQQEASKPTQISFHIHPNANVDAVSVRTIEQLLIDADKDGRLETFKARMAA